MLDKKCEIQDCGRERYGTKPFCRRHERQKIEGKKFSVKNCKGCNMPLSLKSRPDTLFCSNPCKMKYHRKEGSYKKERLIALKRICSMDDCNEPIRAHGLCNRHNIKFIRYGDPKISRKKQRNFCSINGCRLSCISHGFCSKHYTSFRRYGDPLFSDRKRARLNLKNKHKREYRAWQSMKTRCHNVKSAQYKYYGKRGIKVHAEWRTRDGFLPFLKYVIENIGEHPGVGYQLDRIDSTKNYEPGNIQWLVENENCRKRTNVKLSKTEIDKIRNSYPMETMDVLARKYNVTASHILRILSNEVGCDENYIPNKNRRRIVITDEIKVEIKHLREKNHTVLNISKILNVSTSSINNVLLGGKKGTKVNHPLYQLYSGIKARCSNPKHSSYSNYGQKGIKMCESWRNDFWVFVTDVGHRPSKFHSLDRIKPNGNYEPGNVRWATYSEQNKNKSFHN